MPENPLSQQALNRALLARQLLLRPSNASIPEVLHQVGGLQTQYAPSGYVGLWTRMAEFQRDDLTAALNDRSVIQATLLRGTIHLVARDDYWPLAIGIRRARREWWVRFQAGSRTEADIRAGADRLRDALADGPKTVKELGDLASGFLGNVGLFVDLVRVPPSGTWERRRADLLALAEQWVGPEHGTEGDGLRALTTAYLRAFGPAPWKDISAWSGVPVAPLEAAGNELDLLRHRGGGKRELLDLPRSPLPDPETRAPVRFLPHWDANLLVHARRTGILPEAYRPSVFSIRNPFSVGVVLVDGRVVAAWSFKNAGVLVEPYEPLEALGARVPDAIEAERARLEALAS